MATDVYNQASVTITVDGFPITGLHEGTSFTYIRDGGEVQKTQGTDGAAINIATDQGATLRFTLKETSASHSFLSSLKRTQARGGSGVTVVIRTGADVLHLMNNAYVSNPGELASGDKTQAGIEYTIMSADVADSNMIIGAAGAAVSGLLG